MAAPATVVREDAEMLPVKLSGSSRAGLVTGRDEYGMPVLVGTGMHNFWFIVCSLMLLIRQHGELGSNGLCVKRWFRCVR